MRRGMFFSRRSTVGSFLGFSPGSNATVAEFSTIYVNYSAGRDPAEVAAERRAREEAADAAREAREEARKKAEAAEKKAAEDKKKKDDDG